MRRRRRGEKEEEEEPTKWRMARLSGWGGSKRRHPVGGSHHQTIKTIFECLKHTAGTVCSSSCTSATATIVNVHCDLWSIRADDSTGWHNFDTEQTKPYQLIWWICNRFQMIIGFFFLFQLLRWVDAAPRWTHLAITSSVVAMTTDVFHVRILFSVKSHL